MDEPAPSHPPAPRGSYPLAVLGLSAAEEDLYRLALRNTGNAGNTSSSGDAASSVQQLAEVRGSTVGQVEAELSRLSALGLVNVTGDLVSAARPDRAIGALIADEGGRLQTVSQQLDDLRGLLPSLTAEHLASHEPRGEPVAVEAITGGDVGSLIRSLSAASTGDLLWMRPDQWQLPVGRDVDDWVKHLVAGGRRSRALYPARVLEEAPDVVRSRAEAGEHLRIVATVPARLAIMGGSAALVPAQWDSNTDERLVVRQPGIISALTLLFDRLWERAMPVPGLDGQQHDTGRAAQRRLLLDQLAAGAKDEQIARTLGLSLRTVRRRVAEALDELGVDSRFQAGAEAVRRGWI